MKLSGNIILTLLVLIVIASLYRIMPGRPWGFAPQWAIGIFAGAIIKDKKLAFLLPILSLFISDALYEVLYKTGVGSIPGFYTGQLTNYILFGAMTIFGMMIRNKINVTNIFLACLAAPTAYFLISNGMLWINGGGLQRPKTFAGLLLCYSDGLPFYGWSIVASIVFSAILFGGYAVSGRKSDVLLKQIA